MDELNHNFIEPINIIDNNKIIQNETNIKSSFLEDKDEKIKQLKLELSIEKLKNKIYTQIISQSLNIKIDDFYIHENGCLQLSSEYDLSNIPIILKNKVKSKKKNKQNNEIKNTSINEHKKELIDEKKDIIKSKANKDKDKDTQNNEIINNSVSENKKELIEEKKDIKTDKDDKQNNEIINNNSVIENKKELSEEKKDIIKSKSTKSKKNNINKEKDEKHYEEDIENSNTLISNAFEEIRKQKTYSKQLELIQDIRKRYFYSGKYDYDQYIIMIKEHITKLEEIFKMKEYSNTKVKNSIIKSLTPLEIRLITYSDEWLEHKISIEDINDFKISLHNSMDNIKEYKLFDYQSLIPNFTNITSIILPLKFNLERLLLSKSGFNNIIYIENIKSTKSDPYSFYTYNGIDQKDGKRKWELDCRLNYFSNDFIEVMKDYYISNFRKLYYTIFKDNDYHQDYLYKNYITEFELEQIIHNLFLVKNKYHFSDFLRKMIIEKSTYFLDKSIDKLNLSGDDSLLKQEYQKYSFNIDKDYTLIKSLFDKINDIQISQIYSRVISY
jgi:hypothetical protein